ncbi:MAG: Rpn family recombination-promoting nuclease/putative transposase, partial [Mangrovibacterium sp.]
MRYLDPKNDLTFKRIFGDHPNLVMSLLNALLPLEEDQKIESVEYLTPELAPEIPRLKDSIVDVRCKDNRGRHFIVEMQMQWTQAFMARVVFNASKAYVKQLGRGKGYESLQPVYALNLVDEIYIPDSEEFYHHYRMVSTYENDEEQRLEGLEFVFVELPKFKAEKMMEKRMAVLWLRFLTEIQHGTQHIPTGIGDTQELKEALDILQESRFSEDELEYYDRYWDGVSRERTLINGKTKEAVEKGMAEVLEKGLA